MSETTLETLEIELLEQKIRVASAEALKLERENRYHKAMPLAHGHFSLLGTIQERNVHSLISDIDTWSNNHPGQPITLTINSPGGTVIDGYALFDYLQSLRERGHHLTTTGLGMQASMGGVLLQAGDERVMSTHSWLLIHEVQGLAAGSFSEMDDDMKFNKRLQDQALDILVSRSNVSRNVIRNKWKRKDWWLSAQDALKAGFIDRIDG